MIYYTEERAGNDRGSCKSNGGTNEYEHATVHSVCAYIKRETEKGGCTVKVIIHKRFEFKTYEKRNEYDEYKARIFGGMLSIERCDDDIGGGTMIHWHVLTLFHV